MGTTVGNNLFHSFSQFNLSPGDVATFSGPANIRNVISRVTGGSPSTIDGTIYCSIAGANFFFINPFGVMFGPNAQVNVSGAFAVTTADYVKLGNGGRFDARNPANDVLTAAPVTAFGFLGNNPGSITVQGPLTANPDGTSTLPLQSTLSFIGGDITLDGASIPVTGGRINLISIKSPGELALDVTEPQAMVDTSAFAALGAVSFVHGSTADVSSDDAGTVPAGKLFVNADSLSMDSGSALGADNFNTENGGGIEVDVRGNIALDGTFFSALNLSSGNGAVISLTASSIHLANSTEISTSTVTLDQSSTGNAGNIAIRTGSLDVENSNISAQTATPGAAGNLTIIASSIRLANSSLFGISSEGQAGSIVITADSLTLVLNSAINTETDGPAMGGNINITASSIIIDGRGQATPTGISSSTAADFGPMTGSGGSVVIHGGTVTLRNGAAITTSTETSGDGGNINIQAANLTVDTGASIASSATSSGKAGSIVLSVGDAAVIENGSTLSVSSDQSDGGDIDVTASHEILLNKGTITAEANGNGGNVTLTTPSLVYLRDSRISAAAINGHGGNITIDPALVVLNNSQISANAIKGNGGNINITAGSFLQFASQVTATSQFGLQGSVQVTAPDADLLGSLIPLSATPLDAASQLKERCAIRQRGGISTFIVSGREGVPIEPDSLQPSFEPHSPQDEQ
jgi:filamentous hemagglutinin family protein